MKPSLLVLAVALALPACKKDAPEASLPAATQVGANTAGCLIDGKPFIAANYGGGVLSNPIPALQGGFAFDSVYYINITGTYEGERATISLFLRPDRVGAYMLNKTTQYYPQGDPFLLASHATFVTAGSGGEVYVTNARYIGQVVLSKADIKSGIGAGTFEFIAASTFDSRKTVTITNGRFDRKQ